MKAVLISIQPKWCELIASGKKTVEVRKTKPKLEMPFKCYIYETKDKHFANMGYCWGDKKFFDHAIGKVIGEFVCDSIEVLTERDLFEGMDEINNSRIEECSCVDIDELLRYKGSKNEIYAWHISNLKIYDKPRALSEFYAEGDCDCMNCKKCAWFDSGNGYNVEADCNLAYKGVDLHKSFKPILRPPQSWCYVESK